MSRCERQPADGLPCQPPGMQCQILSPSIVDHLMRLCRCLVMFMGVEGTLAAAYACTAQSRCHFCGGLYEKELAERFSLSRGTSERLRLSIPPMAAICSDTSDLV